MVDALQMQVTLELLFLLASIFLLDSETLCNACFSSLCP